MLPIWNNILETLDNIEDRSGAYYIGGTLCVPYAKGREVAMNLNGKGFVIGKSYPHMKNSTVHLPEPVKEKVREVYVKINGATFHFLEEVC